MIDVAQGHIAKLIDAAAVLLLWRVGRGQGSEQERLAVAAFPSQVHIPAHIHLPADEPGAVNSVVGTWSRDNLLDYFASGAGSIRRAGPAGAAGWSGAVGTESAFPVALPAVGWLTTDPGRPYAFLPATRDVFEPDAGYLPRVAAWYRREGQRPGLEDRARESALSAARIAELWLDSAQRGALQDLDAFELELRLRRMGMAGGDAFAQSLGWSHLLIGVDAVRSFNRLLAPWVAATLMPEPFRLGLLDRCFSHAGLCGVLLAANAAAPNLLRAASENRTAPRSLPVRGIKYVQPAGEEPPPDLAVSRLIKAADGVPVFAPIGGHPAGLWEMFLSVRVDRVTRPVLFRQPSPLALRRELDSIHGILVRVGPEVRAGAAEGSAAIEVFVLSDSVTVSQADRHARASGNSLARAVRALWRIDR